MRSDVKILEKYCCHCGGKLERKRYGKRLEEFQKFKRRKFCDFVCMGLARTTLNPSKEAIRKRSSSVKMTSCEKCKTTENLQRHNPDYKKPLLVQILCQVCHKDVHLMDNSWGTSKALESKTCPICEKVFQRVRGESVRDFTQKKTCSRICGQALRKR